MLQHAGMEVFDQSSQCRISLQYWILGTLEILNTRYPIFLKTIQYEPDTDTDTDIITALYINALFFSGDHVTYKGDFQRAIKEAIYIYTHG